MWRDPLDELIDTLETALPVATKHDRYELLPRLVDLQTVASAILFGTDDARERRQAGPLYHTVMAQLAARAQRWTQKS